MTGSPWNRRERDVRALHGVSHEWPEPEHPHVAPSWTAPDRIRICDHIAARFWDVMQGLELVGHVVRRAWERWRDQRPFGRGRR